MCRVNKDDLVMICKLYLEQEDEEILSELQRVCGEIVGDGPGLSKEQIEEELAKEPGKLAQVFEKYSKKEEEKEEAAEEPRAAAVMRGLLKLNEENKIVYEGKWAMNAERFKAGDKSRFKYTFLEHYTGDKEELKPTDGDLSGSFMMKNEEVKGGLVKIDEAKVKLAFRLLTSTVAEGSSTYDVSGEGVNQFGAFNLTGKYDASSNRLAIEKTYKPKDIWADDGLGDDDEEDEFIAGDDESDDGDDIDEAGGGQAELAALLEEATLPVDELKKRYTQKNGINVGAGASCSSSPPSKKAKPDDEDANSS